MTSCLKLKQQLDKDSIFSCSKVLELRICSWLVRVLEGRYVGPIYKKREKKLYRLQQRLGYSLKKKKFFFFEKLGSIFVAIN